ncbi:MAG: MerR family transcriptional regulator [Minwuiales bacterium]|nr:MerR family transcriptional regulator [Minwuiales bacterium]
MAKSPEAFRTISEVASELDVPQHVLRFWETKFSQIKPLKRGGGRRYYRPEDIDLLRRIRSLLYQDGYTIKGVQKVLRENGAKAVVDDQAPEAPRAAPAAGSGLTASQRSAVQAVADELAELSKQLRAIK